MKLLVISSSPFIKKGNDYFAYSPYAKELAIWAKYADETLTVDKFGASAPAEVVFREYGFTVDNAVAIAKKLL